MDAAIARFTALIEEWVTTGKLVGLSVGIVRDAELVYTGAFGVCNLATSEPVTEQSLFHLASVSKPFVATALVQLAERGKIDLDTPVASYLPYFRLADERYPTLTIAQFLGHVAGMPDTKDYGWDRPEADDGALFIERDAGVVWMANWEAIDDRALTEAACEAALGIV